MLHSVGWVSLATRFTSLSITRAVFSHDRNGGSADQMGLSVFDPEADYIPGLSGRRYGPSELHMSRRSQTAFAAGAPHMRWETSM